MPVYNKLVRDLIPKIIKNDQKELTKRILSDDEFVIELRKKIYEELEEYMSAESDEEAIEELADLLEIIHALAKTHMASIEDVEKVRLKKSRERGGFANKVFLIEVKDE